jgi:hypothetical protein
VSACSSQRRAVFAMRDAAVGLAGLQQGALRAGRSIVERRRDAVLSAADDPLARLQRVLRLVRVNPSDKFRSDAFAWGSGADVACDGCDGAAPSWTPPPSRVGLRRAAPCARVDEDDDGVSGAVRFGAAPAAAGAAVVALCEAIAQEARSGARVAAGATLSTNAGVAGGSEDVAAAVGGAPSGNGARARASVARCVGVRCVGAPRSQATLKLTRRASHRAHRCCSCNSVAYRWLIWLLGRGAALEARAREGVPCLAHHQCALAGRAA